MPRERVLVTAKIETSATSPGSAGPQRPGSIPAADGPEGTEFERLYAAEFAFVWRCLRALGVLEAELDDAAQEVFLVVHRRLENVDRSLPLRAWLFGVVRNVAYNQKRSRRRKSGVLGSLDGEPPSQQPSPFDRALAREAAASMQAFLADLSEAKREVFILAELEEWTVVEVAGAVGIPLNTAYSRLRSARIDFESFLKDRESSNERAQ